MTRYIRTRWRLAAAAAMLLTVAACAEGETPDDDPAEGANDADEGDDAEPGDDFPTEEIEFIIPQPAGSAPDVSFRQLAELAEEELGQSIVITNREGGAGSVGLGELAAAEPDGYTLGMGASAMVIVQPVLQDTTFEGPEDFEPIMNAVSATFVMFSPTDRDYDGLDGFVEAAREAPGDLTVGIPGDFTIPHLQMELLKREADIEFEFVSMSPGEQVTAAINGTVDAAVAQPPIVLEHEEDGTVEILGLISPQADDRFDIPLFTDDYGYDIDTVPFEFIVGPAGVPQDRVEVLNDAFRVAFESEEFTEYVEGTALVTDYLDAADLADRLEEQTEVLRDNIDDFGWDG